MSSFYTLSESVVSTIKDLQNQLWKLINSFPSYSFVREPLPVFYVLLTRYCNQDLRITKDKVEHYVSNFSFEYSTDRGELLDEFPESCKKVLIREKEIFDEFFSIITNGFEPIEEGVTAGVVMHGLYKYIHKELVEFFILKYSEQSCVECISPDKVLSIISSSCGGDNECDYYDTCPVYVPFSGLSSYFLYAEEEYCSFMSHCYNEEPDENMAFMAKVRLNAWGYPSRIVSHADPVKFSEGDPLRKWDWAKGWAMVSIPPFGLKVKRKNESGHIEEIDVAEFLINRFVDDENIHTAYLVLPLSFCYSPTFEHLRKKIVDNKYLQEVIEIPAKSFKTTSIATVMIVLSKNEWNRSEVIDFGEMNKRNDKGFLDTVKIDNNLVVSNSYMIVPSLYMDKEVEQEDGQTIMSLGDIVDICEPMKSTSPEEVIVLGDADFINSTDELFVERTLLHDIPLNSMRQYSGKCVVLKKRLNGIAVCPIEGTFATNVDCLVLSLNKDVAISLNYLAHSIVESEQLKAISSYGARLDKTIVQLMMNAKLAIHVGLNLQEAKLVGLKELYIQEKEKEFRAEMERYGIRAASSDLNHLLGPTYKRIYGILRQSNDDDIKNAVRNNVEYISRMIQHAGENFEHAEPDFEECCVNEFLHNYTNTCKDFSFTTFDVVYDTTVDDDTTIDICVDMFTYLFDTILDNAYRHGFEEKKVKDAALQISAHPTSIDGEPYILLSIANNGKPFSNDFSVEKFISRGEKCGNTGHHGLGGNHIYHIIKKHNGYLNITGSSVWPVVYEILIPVKNSYDRDNNFVNYENRANCI